MNLLIDMLLFDKNSQNQDSSLRLINSFYVLNHTYEIFAGKEFFGTKKVFQRNDLVLRVAPQSQAMCLCNRQKKRTESYMLKVCKVA